MGWICSRDVCSFLIGGFMWPFKKKEKTLNQIKKEWEEDDMAWDEFRERVIKHEGLRLKPYRCTAGKLTIGVGRNLDDVGITEEEAGYLLNHDINNAEKELMKAIPWADTMSRRRYYVFVEMVFNLGISRFMQFKKMIEYCRTGDYEKASEEALDSAWHKQVGKRAETLAKILKEG